MNFLLLNHYLILVGEIQKEKTPYFYTQNNVQSEYNVHVDFFVCLFFPTKIFIQKWLHVANFFSSHYIFTYAQQLIFKLMMMMLILIYRESDRNFFSSFLIRKKNNNKKISRYFQFLFYFLLCIATFFYDNR